MNFCPNCGTELREADKFCRKCGTAVIQNVQLKEPGSGEAFIQPAAVNLNVNNNVQQAYDSRKKSRKKILIPIIIISAILLIIGAAAVFTRGFASMRAKYTISQGNKYLSEGKYEEAILDFEKAISIDSRNIDSRLKLADLYIKTGSDEKAQNLLKETLSLDKANQDSYILLGSIYKKQKKWELDSIVVF
jgi:Tfp pilus assembly protein PilF